MIQSYLSKFQIIRPKYESKQKEILKWCIKAHAQSEIVNNQGKFTEFQIYDFKQGLKKKMWNVGYNPDVIEKRGHELQDFLHYDWENMKIYRIHESPYGEGLETRSEFFEETVDRLFEQFYPDEGNAPSDLIHVSSTGYVSPSGAQKIISKRNWGNKTTATHAYHMGCNAAISALRMGRGYLSLDSSNSSDIVHTELCSLHINPSLHDPAQLAIQSLFGDGFIKYTLSLKESSPCFRLLTAQEQVISGAVFQTSWKLAKWGFVIDLGSEIPSLLTSLFKEFFSSLCEKADLEPNQVSEKGIFAVHPNSPDLLHSFQKTLELEDDQLTASRKVLKNHGNMSSATLPHIWEEILQDKQIPNGTFVVSIAVSPGLTISGAILEKCV